MFAPDDIRSTCVIGGILLHHEPYIYIASSNSREICRSEIGDTKLGQESGQKVEHSLLAWNYHEIVHSEFGFCALGNAGEVPDRIRCKVWPYDASVYILL